MDNPKQKRQTHKRVMQLASVRSAYNLDMRSDLVLPSHLRNLRVEFCRVRNERRREHVGRLDSKTQSDCGLRCVFHLNAPFN